MKYIVRDLLTLLIGLFILSSCENPDTIGLDIPSADQVNSTLIDTSTIKAYTVLDDSLVTRGLTQHGLGYINDPQIGTTESNLALGISLVSPAYNFPNNSVLDSAFLVLNYGDEYYGSTATPLFIEVHQLTEKFKSDNYTNNKTWAFDPAILGSKAIIAASIKDSARVKLIITGKPDTLQTMAPQLRIPLDPAFIYTYFLRSDSSKYDDNTKFTNYIKGLYVTVNQSRFPSSMVFFNLANTGVSGLDVYYKSTTGTITDTVFTHFPVTKDSAVVNIKHTYIPAVQTQLDNPAQQFSTIYTQPMGGLRTKLNFPYIDKLKALGNIIINKAELIINVEGGTDAAPFTPAPQLYLYRSDIAGQRQNVPDQDRLDPRALASAFFSGYYDSTNKRYKIVITSYIQDILSGKLKQYDTYIAPVYPNEFTAQLSSPEATGSTAARSILGGAISGNYKMKLNITYTRLK